MTPDDAEEFTASLGSIMGGAWRQIAWADAQGIPDALGLTTREWVETRLGGYVRLTVGERREAAAELTAEGLTQREVADVLGVDQKTVSNDLRSGEEDSSSGERDQDGGGASEESSSRRPQSSEHPAKFSRAIIIAAIELLEDDPPARILDPFAGTGLVHDIADKLGADSIGFEIEPEWAALHERTVCADAGTVTRAMAGTFDAVVTSPTYGNRMADHHEARDESDRGTYRHRLGRELTDGNAGELPWADDHRGDDYRALHGDVWRRVVKLLAPGGRFVLNIKDHKREGRRAPVSAWHVATLLALGLIYVDDNAVPTKGTGGALGDNADTRAGVEHVYLFRKAP